MSARAFAFLSLLLASACGKGSASGEGAAPPEPVNQPAPHPEPVNQPAPHPEPVSQPAPHPEPVSQPAPHPDPANPAAGAPAFSLEARSDPAWPDSTGQLLPVAVRAAAHAGHERVVIELDGEGVPGWHAAYVAAAIADGSGEEVDIAGEHTLQVTLTGIRYPERDEAHRLPRGRQPTSGTSLIEEVRPGSVFEGQSQLFIGLSRRAPFRVFPLSDPPRVVIDIRTTGD